MSKPFEVGDMVRGIPADELSDIGLMPYGMTDEFASCEVVAFLGHDYMVVRLASHDNGSEKFVNEEYPVRTYMFRRDTRCWLSEEDVSKL